MSKEQELIDRYEEQLSSDWAKRYKQYLTDTLIFNEADEHIREEFVDAEVDRLVMLVAETGELGLYAVKCLEKWNVEQMVKADGIIWLLESIVQDRDIKEHGRLVLRWE